MIPVKHLLIYRPTIVNRKNKASLKKSFQNQIQSRVYKAMKLRSNK